MTVEQAIDILNPDGTPHWEDYIENIKDMSKFERYGCGSNVRRLIYER